MKTPRQREREYWLGVIKEMKVEHGRERERLLDRLQHPQQTYSGTQLELGEKVVHDPPKDVEELAWVGQEVPEFVQVGASNTDPELDPELSRIQKMAKVLTS